MDAGIENRKTNLIPHRTVDLNCLTFFNAFFLDKLGKTTVDKATLNTPIGNSNNRSE